MMLREHVNIKSHTTFGIDSFARCFAPFSTIEELKELLGHEKIKHLNKLILGGGSNLLFTKDFNGAVLHNNILGKQVVNETAEHIYLRAGAGENWHQFVQYAIQENYAGLENLSLIPGNVGASPMQNIGAYGVEIKDVFHELEAINMETLETQSFDKNACNFGYRESVFKRALKGKYIITSVTFKLNKTPVFNISYGAIEQELMRMGVKDLSIKSISDAVCNIRNSKLPDPKKIGNAGSFFKNPVISLTQFNTLRLQFEDIVGYKNGEKEMKLAAGWLIEKAGWKGYRQGDAGVHKNQALVLVNYGTAKGAEIYDLSEKIIQSVIDTFGVVLEREVNIV